MDDRRALVRRSGGLLMIDVATRKLPIRWTLHAQQRARQRFGRDLRGKIPGFLVQQIAKRKNDGDDFRIRRGKVVYICQRKDDHVIVITVYRDVYQPKRFQRPKAQR